MEVKSFLTEVILQKIIIDLLCPLTIHQKIRSGKYPFLSFLLSINLQLITLTLNWKIFPVNWLNDTGPGDNYENTNNVLIAGSENQNMTNMEQLRNFRSFVDIVLGFARLFLYSAEKDFRNSKDHCR